LRARARVLAHDAFLYDWRCRGAAVMPLRWRAGTIARGAAPLAPPADASPWPVPVGFRVGFLVVEFDCPQTSSSGF
jgi:hypothetical protein